MSNQGPQVIMVGPFPPPMHGMALVNSLVREQLEAEEPGLLVIDIAAPNLSRGLLSRIGRMPRVAIGLFALVRAPRRVRQTLYISVSGGFGQVYESLFLLVARMRRMRLFLHHHNVGYLVARRWPTHLLATLAGRHAVHITQSAHLAERLRTLYRVKRADCISNAAIIFGAQATDVPARQSLKMLGFISNISHEKGIFEFLDLLAAMASQGLPTKALLAGPFQDSRTEQKVRKRLQALPAVEYVGPQYGKEKDAFFSRIDVLVFPTHNDTEPLVVLEALSRGIPVIAYAHGCIPEIVAADCGLAVPPQSEFVPSALRSIQAWIDLPQAFCTASQNAVARCGNLYEENSRRWRQLRTEICVAGFQP